MENIKMSDCKIFEKQNEFGGKEYTIYIDEFDEYERFINAINTIRDTFENDTVILVINSNGGYLYILNALLHAIDTAKAKSITAEIAGEACSAAAILALACDDIIVTYNSTMLLHSVRGWVNGKLEDMTSHLEINKIQQERIAKRYYKHFLTEDEIADVLSGKELWLTADEIAERWELRLEALQKELENHYKQQEKADLESVIEFLKENGYKIEKLDKDEESML